MRHYEIVFVVHPDQSQQVQPMIDRYKTIITSCGGQIHRIEDWGRRQMAYIIEKLEKAYYVCLNIECSCATLEELKQSFKFNDAILRFLIVKMKKAETSPSPLIEQSQREEDKKISPTSQQDNI